MKEYQVEFIERIERTKASVSYRFTVPDSFSFIAGQYMLLDLGDNLTHPLSLSDCPEETRFIEFTKRMTGSSYCERLESLTREEQVSVKGPAGRFLCNETVDNIAMIAGGIGITPVRSILKSMAIQKKCPSGITLIYGNLDKEDIAFREELENLDLPDFSLIHVLSDPKGVENAHGGFVTADIIAREVADHKNATYMISGPPAMVEAIRNATATLDIPSQNIKTDIFLGYE